MKELGINKWKQQSVVEMILHGFLMVSEGHKFYGTPHQISEGSRGVLKMFQGVMGSFWRLTPVEFEDV